MEPAEPDDPDELIITVPAAHQAGVWANWASVSESDHEFTIDFARVDHSVEPEQGVLVARVGISAKMLRELMDTLTDTWTDYARRVYDEVLPDDRP